MVLYPLLHPLIWHLQVQLQLLTATVKLFLKKPTDSVQRMIQLVLSAATNETDNPDLRDRAYVYWRLLSTDPEVGRQLFCAWRAGEKSTAMHTLTLCRLSTRTC
jgi:vesicle coat complex subunit